METLLGLIAATAFIISGVPLAWVVFRTSRLIGFSRVGWTALSIAVTAILIQLVLAQAVVPATAQMFNTGVVYFVTISAWRKGA